MYPKQLMKVETFRLTFRSCKSNYKNKNDRKKFMLQLI